MSKLLLLPGSKWQLPLAKKIKELGHELCVVSPEIEPPCATYADGFFRSDIFAVESIIKYAKREKIDAVISDECDIAMPVVSEIGERLGLSTLSKKAAALYTDKFFMREFCITHSLKTPEYKLCRSVEDALCFLKSLGRTIIIKPLDSNASNGVFTITTEKELREHFDEAMSFSRVDKAVLAERYIFGTEFTIDGIKTPKAHFTLAISEKKHFSHNSNIANELLFTHSNSNFDYNKLKAANNAFVMASPLEFGFTHAEYKYENGDFYLIEIGARGGGNMISSTITQFMSGYDTYKYLIDCSIGKVNNEDFSIKKSFSERASILKFFQTPNGGGKVTKITGTDYLDSEEKIPSYQFNFSVGDEIENAKNDSARIGFYIATADSIEELERIVLKVDENVKVCVRKN